MRAFSGRHVAMLQMMASSLLVVGVLVDSTLGTRAREGDEGVAEEVGQENVDRMW